MQGLTSLSYDTAHVLDTGVLVLSFALLYQRRLFGVIKIYALQAFMLAAAAAWQAYAQDAPHLDRWRTIGGAPDDVVGAGYVTDLRAKLVAFLLEMFRQAGRPKP